MIMVGLQWQTKHFCCCFSIAFRYNQIPISKPLKLQLNPKKKFKKTSKNVIRKSFKKLAKKKLWNELISFPFTIMNPSTMQMYWKK